MKDVFADRFLKCTTSQGVVRLDFGRVESIDNDKNEISVAPSSRLILPIDGFVHFADQVAQLRDKISEQEKNTSSKSNKSKNADIAVREKKDTDSVH